MYQCLLFSFAEVQVKVVDTEGNPVPKVIMKYMDKANMQKAATGNDEGVIVPTDETCHGQELKDLTFEKEGYCNYKQTIDIEDSPSFYLQVALRKTISKFRFEIFFVKLQRERIETPI